MELRVMRHGRGRTGQTGVAAILLLVIVVMGSLYALLSSVNTATAELQSKRDDATTAALRQAKEALIAWSATHANGPGHLLCPDNNNDGIADTVACGTAATRVGRLPWRTLGLPDLRDPSGRRLWYAVSRCFLERSPDPSCGTYAVNSDTQGQLTLTGLMQASGIVAIIFAPGPALGGQVRADELVGCGPAPENCQAANFLEGENANAPVTAFENMVSSTDLFEVRRRCEQVDCPGLLAFNDQLVTITRAELFDVVENVVAKRIETEVVPVINAYFAAWGNTYPYAAPFDARPAAPLAGGMWNRLDGLLPIDAPPADAPAGWRGWESCVPAAIALPPSAVMSGVPNGVNCDVTIIFAEALPPPPLRFSLTTSADATPRGYVGRGFFGRYEAASTIVRLDQDNLGTPLVSWLTPPPPGTTYGAVATTNAVGQGIVEYGVTTPASAGTITLRIGPPVVSSALAAATTGPLQWFFANNWHRLTYYRISAGVAAGMPGCGGLNPPCLTVNGPGTASAPARAALVLAGRALPSQNAARSTLVPPAPLDAAYFGDFFEGENNELAMTPGTFARQLRSITFNDKVVAVAP